MFVQVTISLRDFKVLSSVVKRLKHSPGPVLNGEKHVTAVDRVRGRRERAENL